MTGLDGALPRRHILKAFLGGGPTLALAARVGWPGSAGAFPTRTPKFQDVAELSDLLILTGTPKYYDLLIDIGRDNRVSLEVPRMECGQGIKTTIGMMVADNLDVPFESMDISLSKAEPRRQHTQITGGSHSTRSLWDPVRVICAEIRARLLTAASHKMGVPVSELRTEDGYVVARSGAKVAYGELTEAAKTVTPEAAPRLKPASEFKIIGRGHPREDARAIVTGQARYAMDLFPSGEALPTVVAMPATFGATLVSIDDSVARSMPGVIAITHVPGLPDVQIPEAVAVTAATFGQAKKAKNALKINWSSGPMDQLSDAEIDDLLRDLQDDLTTPETGDGLIDAEFRWPYIPHAPLETNTSVADVRADHAEIWGGDKWPIWAHRHIAETLGLEGDQVTFHVIPSGGSFGRRVYHDAHVHAAQVSQRIGRPVKLMWLREEDLGHGRSRPVSLHRVRATVRDGDVVSFEHRMACSELDFRFGLGDALSTAVSERNNGGMGQYIFFHTVKLPYKTGVTTLSLQQKPLAKPTGTWRNVYSGQVGALNEIVIHELAGLVGQDEVDFRMNLLDSARAKAVLEKAVQEGQWGRRLPAGVAQGIGMHNEYHSIVAYLMEIDTRRARPRMTRCTIAVDNGFCINPTGAAAQLLGAAMDGFAVAFQSGVHVDKGVTRESNFNDYKWPRMFDAPPEMTCHILPNTNVLPGGMGELGVPAATAAAANAWARATGRLARSFPLNQYAA